VENAQRRHEADVFSRDIEITELKRIISAYQTHSSVDGVDPNLAFQFDNGIEYPIAFQGAPEHTPTLQEAEGRLSEDKSAQDLTPSAFWDENVLIANVQNQIENGHEQLTDAEVNSLLSQITSDSLGQ
jgi:hypothetical protein